MATKALAAWRASRCRNIDTSRVQPGEGYGRLRDQQRTASGTRGVSTSCNTKNQTASITANGVTTAMTYSGALQTERVQKGSTTYTHSVLGLASEKTGTSTTYYIRDDQGQLVAKRSGTATWYYLFDGLGNTVALVDGTGTVTNSYRYDPYGNPVSKTEGVANPYEFGGAYGAYTDDETSLVKIGARHHDPQLGRWVQQDLLTGNLMSPTALNRYAYAGYHPTGEISEVLGSIGRRSTATSSWRRWNAPSP